LGDRRPAARPQREYHATSRPNISSLSMVDLCTLRTKTVAILADSGRIDDSRVASNGVIDSPLDWPHERITSRRACKSIGPPEAERQSSCAVRVSITIPDSRSSGRAASGVHVRRHRPSSMFGAQQSLEAEGSSAPVRPNPSLPKTSACCGDVAHVLEQRCSSLVSTTHSSPRLPCEAGLPAATKIIQDQQNFATLAVSEARLSRDGARSKLVTGQLAARAGTSHGAGA
jgi:hypothetical protein